MNSTQAVARIKEIGIVPIVRAPSADAAVRAAEAITEGGIPCVEITMTVPGALQALEQAAKQLGSYVLLGAGTVLDPETARVCLSAGADFFVTPSLNLRTIEFAKRYAKAIFPGALTPTEIVAAWESGADGVKIFPCSALGGAKYIKALRGPFPQIEFVPTGGVNLETLADFIRAGCSAVGVGGELCDAEAIKNGKYDVIRDRAKRFRERLLEARQ